jgi:hypothetical protein
MWHADQAADADIGRYTPHWRGVKQIIGETG